MLTFRCVTLAPSGTSLYQKGRLICKIKAVQGIKDRAGKLFPTTIE